MPENVTDLVVGKDSGDGKNVAENAC